MRTLIPLAFITVLLCGCPDSKLPNTPPKAPQPKISRAPTLEPVSDAATVCKQDENLA